MKILVWKENYKGRVLGQIERVSDDSDSNNWSDTLKNKVEFYPLNQPITDKPIMIEIVTVNPGYFLKINETQASPEKWTKEGEEDVFEQPMIAERWSDGITTVWAAEDIPLVDGEPDTDFVYFPAMMDDSWTYVPAVEYSWEIVEDTEVKTAYEQQQAIKNAVSSAISFGQQLLVDFAAENVAMGITQDGMTKTVRQNMAEVIAAISTGSLYDAIDEIDAIPAEAKDDKYITDERLATYKQKILDYLA